MTFFILAVGLCVGSFLNVLIYRLPRGKSVIKGRSYCPSCKRKIYWYDNVPVISFLILGGRCRFCRQKISWRYPIVELLTFFLTYLFLIKNIFPWPLAFFPLLVIWSFIPLALIDFEWRIINEGIVIFDIFVLVIFKAFTNFRELWSNNFPTAVGAAIFFLLLFIITRGKGLGFGDVELAFLLGLFLGFPKGVLAMYLAFLTGALVGLILIAIKRLRFGQTVPFGPFLAFGGLFSFFWGEKIIFLLNSYLFK